MDCPLPCLIARGHILVYHVLFESTSLWYLDTCVSSKIGAKIQEKMRQLDSLFPKSQKSQVPSFSYIFLQTCALAGFQVTTSPPLSLPSGLAKLAACLRLRSGVHITLCHQFFQLPFGQDFLSNGKPHLAKEPRRGSKLWQWTVANRIAGKAFLQCYWQCEKCTKSGPKL